MILRVTEGQLLQKFLPLPHKLLQNIKIIHYKLNFIVIKVPDY